MPASKDKPISPDSRAGEPNSPDRPADAPAVDLERLSTLVADGEVHWPDNLSEEQAAQLTAEVRRRRRSGLIKLIARLIAAELWRDKPPRST